MVGCASLTLGGAVILFTVSVNLTVDRSKVFH